MPKQCPHESLPRDGGAYGCANKGGGVQAEPTKGDLRARRAATHGTPPYYFTVEALQCMPGRGYLKAGANEAEKMSERQKIAQG